MTGFFCQSAYREKAADRQDAEKEADVGVATHGGEHVSLSHDEGPFLEVKVQIGFRDFRKEGGLVSLAATFCQNDL